MTDTTPPPTTDAGVIAQLAKDAQQFPMTLADDGSEGIVLTEGQRLEDLERYQSAPRRKTGSARLGNTDSFIAYVDRHSLQRATTLWSDVDQARIVAVLDDHTSHIDPETAGAPGWGQHRATLQLQHTKDWLHWTKLDGKYVDQKTFAEHIEDGVDALSDPEPATMLEVAQTFHAKNGVSFTSSRQLSGDIEFAYEENTAARAGMKGRLEVPQIFTLGLAPFNGCDAYAVRARLRYRLNDGNLSIGYRLIRPDRALESAFDDVVQAVAGASGFPVMAGTPRSS